METMGKTILPIIPIHPILLNHSLSIKKLLDRVHKPR